MAELLVSNDYSRLKKVIVQHPGHEARHVQLFAPYVRLGGFAPDTIGENAYAQHHNFTAELARSGAEVLEAHQLIDSAFDSAGEATVDVFLEEKFPRLARLPKNTRRRLRGADLIGARGDTFYPKLPGKQPFQTHPLQWMYYTRDFAVTLPRGIALTAFDDGSRIPETSIARFMFAHAPALQKYPIIFDAEKEGVLMQGGDMIVLNEKTLLMGVRNLSSKEAAKKIAKKTNMDVLGVNMPKGVANGERNIHPFTAINLLFLHLDTIFNLLDQKKALAIPYFLQDEFNAVQPFFAILDSIQLETLTTDEREKLRTLKKVLQDFGKVTVFKAGTGEAHPTGKKLVTYLQDEHDFSFAFAGGEPERLPRQQIQHLTQDVFPEVRFQAANVVATAPSKVIMYQDDTYESQGSLRDIGVNLTLVDAHELVRWNGGPHCMTMPLEREINKS